MKKIIPIILLFALGCSTKVYNSDIRRSAAIIRLYMAPESYPQQYKIIKEVKGQHCQLSGWKEPSTEKALQDLRLEAAAIGGKGVINIACQDTGAIFPCGDSVTCVGDAIE